MSCLDEQGRHDIVLNQVCVVDLSVPLSVLQNYEYAAYWHLYQDGSIEFQLKVRDEECGGLRRCTRLHYLARPPVTMPHTWHPAADGDPIHERRPSGRGAPRLRGARL